LAVRFADMKASAIVIAGCAGSAAIGLVWLSVALHGLLSLVISPPFAAGLVAAGFLVVPLWVISRRASGETKLLETEKPVGADSHSELISMVTEAAEKMAPSTPLTAMAFALTGGALSVHVPTAVTPLLLRLVAQDMSFDRQAESSPPV